MDILRELKWDGERREEEDGEEGSANHKQKTKRVRTSFTEEQLRVLHANFRVDSNPDGQDLERIAQQTGLSKRVTQVWFQNSRARQKKHQQTSPPAHSASRVNNNNNNNGHNNNNINNNSLSHNHNTGSNASLSGGGALPMRSVALGNSALQAYNISGLSCRPLSPSAQQQPRLKLEDSLLLNRGGYPCVSVNGLHHLEATTEGAMLDRDQDQRRPILRDNDHLHSKDYDQSPVSCLDGYYPTDDDQSN